MKYLSITKTETLSSLTEKVGIQNVDQILADNHLKRTPLIGNQWVDNCTSIIRDNDSVTAHEKVNILNSLVSNADIYEAVALASEDEWKVIKQTRTLPAYLYISDQLDTSIPDSYNLLGNNVSVAPSTYNYVNKLIMSGEAVDGSMFLDLFNIDDVYLGAGNITTTTSTDNPMSWFKIPQGDVLLYSSISDAAISIPAYPETLPDTRTAEYQQMPDLLYQYEPWQMYSGSGPRSVSVEFHLHRDMWTGDHNDGKANQLIRFCQAQCYPKYNGALVHAPTVSLYISGSCYITGVMTGVDIVWSGPLGADDNWYLEFNMTLNITEVSKAALNYDVVMSKSLIG